MSDDAGLWGCVGVGAAMGVPGRLLSSGHGGVPGRLSGHGGVSGRLLSSGHGGAWSGGL